METSKVAMWGALKAAKLLLPYLIGAVGSFLAINYTEAFQVLCSAGVQ